MTTSRLRILRVVTRLNVGGPALHVCLLTSRLDQSRFESLLVAGTPGADEGDMLELRPELRSELGERLATIPGLGRDPKPGADLRALRHLRRLVRQFRPHIVHTHMAKAGTLGRIVAWANRVPLRVHTFHGTVFEGHFRSGIGNVIAKWERVMGRITDQVLAVSPAVAADLQRRGIAKGRIRVLPLGLDLERFRAVRPLNGEPPHVVSLIARLVPVKDIPLFLNAVEIARRELPDLEARVLGDGLLRNELEASAPAWVRFLGNRADLPAQLQEAGTVVLTSHSEGSPVALIEALAAARPVVAVPVGGVVDILDGRPGAVITSDRSPWAVAHSIVRVLVDSSFAEGAAAGREAMATEFGASRLISDMEELYEELWQERSALRATATP